MALIVVALALLLVCAPAYANPCPKDTAGEPCSMCKKAAADSKWADSDEADQVIKQCYECATKNPNEAFSCYSCMASSREGVDSGTAIEVSKICLSCITEKGVAGWSCNQFCAAAADAVSDMEFCVACLESGKRGINTWGCVHCMERAPDSGRKQDCMQQCVEEGYDSWACGECAGSTEHDSDEDIQACYTCLSDKTKNTFECINPK